MSLPRDFELDSNELTMVSWLTLYTLISVYIFSILISIHFLRCWHREFVQQSRASLVGDHFLNSHDPNVWFRGDNERRNLMLITLRGQRVKNTRFLTLFYLPTVMNVSLVPAIHCIFRYQSRPTWCQQPSSVETDVVRSGFSAFNCSG